MPKRRILFTILLVGAVFGASAGERDYSLSVGIARSSVDARVHPDLPRFDFQDSGLHVVAGAPLADWLGFELGWTDFGSAHPGIIDTVSGSAAWVALAPRMNVGRFTVSGKVGAARTMLDLRHTPSGISGHKTRSTEPLVGVVASYRINEQWGAAVALERIGDVATTVGLNATYHWRIDDSPVRDGPGIELLVGTTITEHVIDEFRFSLSSTQDVVITDLDHPTSGLAVGLRYPYRPWLAFELVHFPKSTRIGYASGPLDPPPAFPPGSPGPPPPSHASFDSHTDISGNLLAARFEYGMLPDFDVFASIGALQVRESVALRNDFTDTLYHRESASTTTAWLGVGFRYRVYKALSLTVEHGKGGRSRAMLGWTF